MRLAVAAAVLSSAALSLSSLTAIHGVESALVLGVVLPLFATVVAACIALRARDDPQRSPGTEAAWAGLVLWTIPFVLLAIGALRVRNCAPLEGVAFMLLGPGAGVALALVTGLLAGSLVPGRALAIVLSLVPPLLGIVLSVADFLQTPAVFFYGHYFGYFAGSIYDELIHLPSSLWVLRAITAALIGSGLLLLRGTTDRGRPLALSELRRGPLAAAIALVTLCAAAHGRGESLGLRASHAYIAAALGAEVKSERCELFVPRELADKARFGRDCDVRVRQMEHFFGLRRREPVRVYLFRSAAEKRALMGAGKTNIAKPWRGEIYLQQESFPHPIMGHEIAHIVVAAAGRGPLRVTGQLGGLWPNLGLVEGMAVAADFRSASGMTPDQWARATLELDRIPPLAQLLGAGFLATHKRLAYVLSGSFIRHLRDTHGRQVLRAIYMGGDVALAAGTPLAELELAWHAHLRAVPLPSEALALAQQRFSGASILSAVCPHRVAELRRRLAGDLAAGDDRLAADSCRAILALDPDRATTRATLVGTLSRLRDPSAVGELTRLQDSKPRPKAALATARHELADELFRRGDVGSALTAYDALLEAPQEPNVRRLLEVKRMILQGSSGGQALMADLLVPQPGRRAPGAVATHLARELRAERSDGLPHYLEARQLYFGGEHARAANLMAVARARGLATAALRQEALRVEALCRTILDEPTAGRLWRMFGREGTQAQQMLAEEFLQRIRIARGLR